MDKDEKIAMGFENDRRFSMEMDHDRKVKFATDEKDSLSVILAYRARVCMYIYIYMYEKKGGKIHEYI